jgi:hypothetical protein
LRQTTIIIVQKQICIHSLLKIRAIFNRPRGEKEFSAPFSFPRRFKGDFEIGFVWLCFFTILIHINIHKSLPLLT